MEFEIYETRHLVSQLKMKVITEVNAVTNNVLRFKKKEEDGWIETTKLFFTRYVKTYSGGHNNISDKKIVFFAYECLYMYIVIEAGHGHTRDYIDGDPNMIVICGTVNNTNDHRIIIRTVDDISDSDKQVDRIIEQYNLDAYATCYFNLDICVDNMEKYDGKVYSFIVQNNEDDKSLNICLTQPEPGMRYICTLEEINENNDPVGDENGKDD